MTTNTAREVVDRYFIALTQKDFVTMRSLLDDDATLPVAQWLKVRDNRIIAVRLYFDARPYA